MLEKIEIKNFQSHKKTTLEFTGGVTSITGPSDVGKSAIIRALSWVLTNYPQGTDFIRNGARAAEVTLHIDGHVITRRRSKSENTYILNGTELKAFGQGVPDPIAEIVNVGDDNFQSQHDAPFWFSDTPGQVSRKLNAVVDLGVIDDSLAEINRKRTQARTRAEVLVDELGQVKEQRDRLKFVAGASDDFDELQRMSEQISTSQHKSETLAEHIDQAKRAEAHNGRAALAADAWEAVTRAFATLRKAKDKRDRLRDCLSRATDAERAAQAPVPDTDGPEQALVALQRWRDKRVRLAGLFDKIDQAKQHHETTKREAADAESKYLEISEQGCPLCGRVK